MRGCELACSLRHEITWRRACTRGNKRMSLAWNRNSESCFPAACLLNKPAPRERLRAYFSSHRHYHDGVDSCCERSSQQPGQHAASSHRLKLLNKQLSLRENKHTTHQVFYGWCEPRQVGPSRRVCTRRERARVLRVSEWVGDLAGIKPSLAPLLCTANSILEFGCQIKPFPSAPAVLLLKLKRNCSFSFAKFMRWRRTLCLWQISWSYWGTFLCKKRTQELLQSWYEKQGSIKFQWFPFF